MIRYASVCSGVEAASLAWIPLGWEPVFFSEIEPFPCAVLKERFPNVPNIGDMTKIEGEKYRGAVDLLVGGTPCQGFSVAGKQGGLDDPRSALCLAFTQLLKTMRPLWFVWENVPGVFSTNGGQDFKSFLWKIDEIGYSLAWRVLDAQYVRVDGYPRAIPQLRRRVFVVGHLGADWQYPAKVLFEPESLCGDTPPRRITGKSPAGTSTTRADKTNCVFRSSHPGEFVEDSVAGSIKTNIQSVGNSSATLTVESGIGFYTDAKSAQTLETHEDQRRRSIVCAHETGKGFWQGGDIAGTLRAEGENRPSRPSNIICAGFCQGASPAAGSIGYHEQVSPTIKAGESGTNQVPACICQYGEVSGTLAARYDSSPCADRGMNVVYENHAQDSRIKKLDGACSQISAKAGTGGNNLPIVQECYPINSMIINKEAKPEDRQTTGTTQHHAVAIAENIIGRKVQNGGNGIGAQEELAYTQNTNGVMGVSQSLTVRRILPVETERLMGFPDNWTQIPWRGKPAEQCPDSPRYKACGNSMCVNVMRWIGMRIENMERKK